MGRPPCLTFFVRLFISKQGRSSESPAITAQAQTSQEGGRANPWPGRPACQSLTLPEGGFLPPEGAAPAPRGWCKVSRDVAPEGLGPGGALCTEAAFTAPPSQSLGSFHFHVLEVLKDAHLQSHEAHVLLYTDFNKCFFYYMLIRLVS